MQGSSDGPSHGFVVDRTEGLGWIREEEEMEHGMGSPGEEGEEGRYDPPFLISWTQTMEFRENFQSSPWVRQRMDGYILLRSQGELGEKLRLDMEADPDPVLREVSSDFIPIPTGDGDGGCEMGEKLGWNLRLQTEELTEIPGCRAGDLVLMQLPRPEIQTDRAEEKDPKHSQNPATVSAILCRDRKSENGAADDGRWE